MKKLCLLISIFAASCGTPIVECLKKCSRESLACLEQATAKTQLCEHPESECCVEIQKFRNDICLEKQQSCYDECH